MNQEIVPLSEPLRWAEALAGVAHPCTHAWSYCSAMARSSGLETFLWVGEDRGARYACPLSVRAREPGYPDLVSPYGFGGVVSSPEAPPPGDLRAEWMRFWKDRGFITAYVLQHPAFQLSRDVWGEDVYEHHMVYEVDLAAPAEDLWQRMGTTHRYEIRRCQKDASLRVVAGGDALKQALLRLYPETVDRVGASGVYRFCAETLGLLAEGPGSLLLGVEENGNVEALALFLYTPRAAEYFLNASTVKGRKYARLLVWSAVERLKEAGVRALNLGGGVRDGDSLDDFKRRFGGRPVRSQVLKQVFDTGKYEQLLVKYHVTGDDRTGYFPPYWSARAGQEPARSAVQTGENS